MQHLVNSPGNVIAYAAKSHRRARLFEAFGEFFSAYYGLCIIITDCIVVFWLFVASLVVYSTFKCNFRYIDTPTKRSARDGVGLVELVPMPTHFVIDVSWSVLMALSKFGDKDVTLHKFNQVLLQALKPCP